MTSPDDSRCDHTRRAAPADGARPPAAYQAVDATSHAELTAAPTGVPLDTQPAMIAAMPRWCTTSQRSRRSRTTGTNRLITTIAGG